MLVLDWSAFYYFSLLPGELHLPVIANKTCSPHFSYGSLLNSYVCGHFVLLLASEVRPFRYLFANDKLADNISY